MRIKCLYNTGEALMAYERKPLGTNPQMQFGGLEVGREYLVMGMILTEGYLTYLIDDDGLIMASPGPLFEVVEQSIPAGWFFQAFAHDYESFEYKEAIWGYHELVFDEAHYWQLLEQDDDAYRVYFRRKIEFENSLAELG